MVRQLAKTEQAKRRQQRQKLTLKGRMVSAGMQERYRKSVAKFLSFTAEFGYQVASWEDLDEVVSEWLEHIFHDGQPARQ